MPAIAMLILGSIVGACLGSFTNVVISRGPRAWGLLDKSDKPSGLAFPPSQCEDCGQRIAARDLIPVISWLILRGRCRHCGSSIGTRHVVVECLGAVIVPVSIMRFGLTPDAALAILWLFGLLALAVIDAETGFLPDALTLPLLVMGLIAAALGYGPSLQDALIGAAVGGGSFYLLAFLYRRWRGQEGLGGGDVKLLAAAGAWSGPWVLPSLVLMASLSALVIAGALILQGKSEQSLQAEIRFGPFLALGAAIVFLVPIPMAVV